MRMGKGFVKHIITSIGNIINVNLIVLHYRKISKPAEPAKPDKRSTMIITSLCHKFTVPCQLTSSYDSASIRVIKLEEGSFNKLALKKKKNYLVGVHAKIRHNTFHKNSTGAEVNVRVLQ